MHTTEDLRRETDETLKRAEKVGLPSPQGTEMGKGWGRAEGWKQENKQRLNVCDTLHILTLLTMFRVFGIFFVVVFTYTEYLKIFYY